MPIYTYKCEKCATTVDKIRKMNDTSIVLCESCRGSWEGVQTYIIMEQVPAVPSPMQWGCKRF